MAAPYGLSYLNALEKVIEIVKRDAGRMEAEKGNFYVQAQIECLLEAYTDVDLDTAFKKIGTLEKNKNKLLEDISFILEMHFIHHQQHRSFNFPIGIRYLHLLAKYGLQSMDVNGIPVVNISSIALAFPVEEYNIKKENPSLCRGIPNEMKKYKNFKREYDVMGIFALLPPGKNYGGFVKAFLNVQLLYALENHPELRICGEKTFQVLIAKLRRIYNSSIFSKEKRQEWFDKLCIKEEDCALWSRLFDQQWSGYKDVHMFFEQVY